MIEIKLCGLKEPTHLETAYNLGVKYVGFVFFENSKRFLNNETAKSLISHTHPNIIKVGLVVNPNDVLLKSISDLGLDMVQLHGSETVSRVKEIRSKFNFPLIKAIGVNDQILIDAKPSSVSSLPGGNGVKFDWKILKNKTWSFPWFLAGGLNEKNVTKALMITKAKKVDLSSGVEDSSGRKCISKITSFVKKIRQYEDSINAR